MRVRDITDACFCVVGDLAFYSFLFLGECPANWMTGPAGSCFKFVLSPGLSWQEAEGSCIDMGGNLAALDTQLKTAVINGYFIMQPSKLIRYSNPEIV